MPRQLPGLYWNHERQRYFPLPRPVAAPSSQQNEPYLTQTTATAPRSIPISRLTLYHALSDLRSVLRNVQKDALIQSVAPFVRNRCRQLTISVIYSQIQSSQISLTDKVTRSIISPQGHLSAFQTIRHSGRVWSFVGDTLGWFYSSTVDEEHEQMDGWQRQFHLSSEARQCPNLKPCRALTFVADIRHRCIWHNMRVGHPFPPSSLD
ncbi:hypothetical protein J3R82DRAFT_9713 [Butyriboletus roseoflavus]|nr:hypothetical protein J3R82DRAFT_9713 [Butyriboletus roseoflavus]